MKYRLRLWPWIGLPLVFAACDRPGEPRKPAEEARGPEVTRARREPREEAPEPRARLRASLAEADALNEPGARDKALAQVAWNALGLDLDVAREALERLPPDSPQRIALIQHFAMRMADENPDAALAWAASLASEREAAAARVRVALVVADSDPARGANLLSEFGLANREFEVAVVQVLQRWAAKNPPDAAAWVAVFPPGEFRKAGIRSVIPQWVENSPQEMFSWLGRQTDDAVRMEAGDAIVESFLRQSPEVREAWMKHADPQVREKLSHALRQPGQ